MRQAEVVVETVPAGMMGRIVGVVAQVPFADAGRGVALRLERLGDGDFAGRQAAGRVPPQNAVAVVAHAAADRVAAGEQGGPAGRADLGGGVEIGEPHPFGGHAVEVGRADARMPVAAQVAPAEIIRQDDDDVGPGRLPLGRLQPRGCTQCEQEQKLFHGSFLWRENASGRAVVGRNGGRSSWSATWRFSSFSLKVPSPSGRG